MVRSVSLYKTVSELPLEVESYELERLEFVVTPTFTRVTTVVHLKGGGEEGIGEDVTYTADDHPPPADLPLAGSYTIDSYSQHLDGLELFTKEPEMGASRDYRRWAFESAALDLALRQAGRSLVDAVELEPRPVTFVSSMNFGDSPSIEPVLKWREAYPDLRFKLDPTSDWSDGLIDELSALGAVDTLDLKGQYKDTPVDQPPNPDLYRRLAESFPGAWLEDPALTPETQAVLEPHAYRVTWDAPIHAVSDIEALLWAPRSINIKPSRFGSVRRLFEAYDYCAEHDIAAYGGGQWELGPGRGQIQYLASLFHPNTPNDVAPGGYNASEPPSGLPTSPLEPAASPNGFRWAS